MTSLQLALLVVAGMLTSTGCRHDCAMSGRPRVRFSSPSCCIYAYYWDPGVKDCVLWQPLNDTGCFCTGECDRLFPSLAECRQQHRHCR